jgi:sugar/nucleoside kinase (ribokinase family)
VDLEDGDRVFVTSNKGGVLFTHPLEFSEKDLEYIASYDIIHTSNNSFIDRQLGKLSILPNRLSYDFSGTWIDEERTKNTCRFLDFGFASCSELTDMQVYQQATKMYSWGCKIVVVTMGPRGVVAFNGQNYYQHQPKLMEPVDTLGAGDSLVSGFLMHFVENTKDEMPIVGSSEYDELLINSLKAGAELSAETCMIKGAFGHGTEMV